MRAILLSGVALLMPGWAGAETNDKAATEASAESTSATVPVEAKPEAAAAAPRRGSDTIVITGARTRLTATALPMTYDVLGGEEFKEQVAVSGSVIAWARLARPSFEPRVTMTSLSGSRVTPKRRW